MLCVMKAIFSPHRCPTRYSKYASKTWCSLVMLGSLLPSAHLVLPGDEIHVWCASLDQPPERVAGFEQTLLLDERSRAQRYRFARDRQHFVIRRGLLRLLLGDYLGIEPGDLQFRSGPYGKLFL